MRILLLCPFAALRAFLIPICVILGARLISAQPAVLDLREFLPYKHTDSTSLISVMGTGFEFRFFSPTRDLEFDWDFRMGTVRRTNFHRMSLRLDSSGLLVRNDTFYDPLAHTSQFIPAWVVAPLLVTEGQVIQSSTTLTNIGIGFLWNGSVTGTVTIGTLELKHTPAGKVPALPLSLHYTWEETGPERRGKGSSTQTWWLTRQIGAYFTDYAWEETDTNGVMKAGSDRFHLVSSTLLTSPEVVHFPDPNLEAAVRARLFKPTGDLTAYELSALLDLVAPA